MGKQKARGVEHVLEMDLQLNHQMDYPCPNRWAITHQAELSELLDRAPQPALTLIQPFDPVDRSVPAASAAVHN